MNDQASALRELRGRVAKPASAPVPGKNSVSLVVTSGKGGVGKTQLSVNLSLALARHKKRVILFDADMGLANVDIVLGIHPEWHLVHVLEGVRKMEQIVVPGPEGIRIVPAGSGVERLANMDSAQLDYLLHELQKLERSHDILIVDTAAGISRSVMQFAVSGDRVIVVVTPEPAAFADAYATIKCVFNHNPSARIGLVVNSCRQSGDGKETFNRMRMLVSQFLKKNVDFFGELPFENRFQRAIRMQKPLVIQEPGCAYAKGVLALARKFAGVPISTSPKGFFGRFLSFLKDPGRPDRQVEALSGAKGEEKR